MNDSPTTATPLWKPSPERIAQSQLTAFAQFIKRELGLSFTGYPEMHDWSINHIDQFWQALWKFSEIIHSQTYSSVVLNQDQFPGTLWFSDSKLNFAENLLRYQDDRVALVALLESGQRRTTTYAELFNQVEQLASSLREQGVKAGDRVAGLMPNVTETVVAMLATTSIGAIWTSCSPDFGVNGACDRFEQIQPKVLFCCESYSYGGKTIDCLAKVAEIQQRLTGLEKTIIVPVLSAEVEIDQLSDAVWYAEFLNHNPEALRFSQEAFDHPVYINYSSGTTGAPKCIVHGAGGTLLQHLKELQLHTDIQRDDVLFYFTTCGWMMWNWLVSGLATGCTLVLYDGSPFAQQGKLLIDAIDQEGITVFGTSAKFIAALEKEGVRPRKTNDLLSLKTILSTGSPLNAHSFDYIYRDFKSDLCLSSISGGTDIISCFVLGNTNLPVYRGEIQCLGLGMAVEMWNDDGQAVIEQKGELVCTKPFPSTPVGFWNDKDNARFLDAYFADYPNVWAHGDYGEITANNGVIIHGRSDAVLNPGGVRIGTAEIYRQVEKIDSVVDSVVIGQEFADDVRVVLFVVLRDSLSLTQKLIDEIKQTIRLNTTPRHVPSKILQVTDIPRTISGKIVEVAVKNVVHNRPVKNTDALANPEALEQFTNRPELRS